MALGLSKQVLIILFNFVFFRDGINGQVSLLFTSNWSGTINDINPVFSLVFNNYVCPNKYTLQFITPGLSFLSTIADMSKENTRLIGTNINHGIGEPNAFINFIFPLPSTATQIQQIYPTDLQILQVVISSVNAMYNPSLPKQNILVIFKRKNDVNNLNIGNYENIIKQLNQQNWYNVKYLNYQSADDVVYQLRLNPFYNIISLLTDDSDNRDLIQKVYLSNLMIWRYWWLIVNLLGEYSLLQNQQIYGLGVLSNNVTIITFADPPSGKTGRAVLLEDSLKLVRTADCDQNKPITFDGLSGSFDITTYSRTNFKYTIFRNPGSNASSRFYIQHDLFSNQVTFPTSFNFAPFTLTVQNSLSSLQARVFRIGFVNYPPFAYKDGTNYTGFIIDLLVDILSKNNISYTFIDMTSQTAGQLNTSNLLYNNLLGMVQNGAVDTLTLGFIITNDRLNYFDFANNFLSGYMSVLINFRTLTGINALQRYVSPFDWNTWVTFLGSALGITIALAISDYVYPDKYARYKLLMSFFFSISSLTHGAYFDPPRKLGGRIIMSFWWLFCLLVIIIWACNYAAYLSLDNSNQQMTTFFALLNQKNYNYGTLNDNLLFNFMAQNNDSDVQSMYQIMREDSPNGTVPDFNSAISLIQSTNYAFIYEDSMTTYYKNQYCLSKFGNWMSFEYGLVLPKNSEKTMFFTSEFTKRRGNGKIDNLTAQYWPAANSSCTSTFFLDVLTSFLQTVVPNYFEKALNISFMIGVFTILIGGSVCSLFLAMLERLIRYFLQRRIEERNKYNYDFTVEQLTKF